MAQNIVQLKANEISRDITLTVHVRGLRWWEFRMKVALMLIRLATWIAGMNYKEEADG